MATTYDAIIGKLRKADITPAQLAALTIKTEILTAGTIVAIPNTTYMFDGSNINLNLDGTYKLGDRIRIRQLSGTNSYINHGKIEGTLNNIILDVPNISFDLVYVNSTYGWIIMETNT